MRSPFPNPEAKPIPLAEFRDRILELNKPPLRSRGIYISTRTALNLFIAMTGVETTADLTTQAIARFVASREGLENPNTTKCRLRCLSAACSIAHAEGWLRISPFAIRSRWVRGVTPKSPPVHSREDIAGVIAAAAREVGEARPSQRWQARRLHALIALAAYTGMRKTEMLTLMVADVDLAAGMIRITARSNYFLKTDGAAKPVAIPDALAPILAGWLKEIDPAGWLFPNTIANNPWTGGSVKSCAATRIKELGKRAGVEGLTFQSFRHSWATHAEYWGISDTMIQRNLRHGSTTTQKHYRHAEERNIRSTLAGIGFGEITRPAAPPKADPPAIAGPPSPPALSAPGLHPDPGTASTGSTDPQAELGKLSGQVEQLMRLVNRLLANGSHPEAPPPPGLRPGAGCP